MINPGPVVEMKTRRTYFLDYPCDLKQGEKVTFILSLHGGGSYGNWQRHYFPIIDYKDKYRLVIATPNSPTRVWSAADDEYLQNIVDVGRRADRQGEHQGVLAGRAFAGRHDVEPAGAHGFLQATRVDGWLSLSGGRLGGSPGRGDVRQRSAARRRAAARARPRPAAAAGRRIAAAMAALRELPASDFSFIFETGEREMDDKGLPDAPQWADALRLRAAAEASTRVVDTKAGYVYDGTRQNPPNPAWGLLPAARQGADLTIPTARTAASSPTSCGSRRDTPKGWSRTSPRSS